jgi:hypothetical protein
LRVPRVEPSERINSLRFKSVMGWVTVSPRRANHVCHLFMRQPRADSPHRLHPARAQQERPARHLPLHKQQRPPLGRMLWCTMLLLENFRREVAEAVIRTREFGLFPSLLQCVNCCREIPSFCIFDCRVVRFRPSRAAAPCTPGIIPACPARRARCVHAPPLPA